MSDCILDASALVMAASGRTPGAAALRAALPARNVHAPHLIDAEVGNVLRRQERAGLLDGPSALSALRAAHSLVDHRYDEAGRLAEIAWDHRHNLTFYDALYVALAAVLDLPLITADARLARSPALPCAVEFIGADGQAISR